MINIQIAIGNLGKDAEVRQVSETFSVAQFSLGTDNGYFDKQEGKWINRTEWLNVVLYNPSDHQKERLTKGATVFVQGKSITEKYEKDGKTQYSTKLLASQVKIIKQAGAAEPNPDNHQQPEAYAAADLDPTTNEDLPF